MSTSIFTFDHGQKSLHKAIGVNKEFLEELARTLAQISKIVVDSTDEDDDGTGSPSRVIELVMQELSYSQLVLAAGFYVVAKLKEMENDLMRKHLSATIFSGDGLPDDMPDELKDILKDIASKMRKKDEE